MFITRERVESWNEEQIEIFMKFFYSIFGKIFVDRVLQCFDNDLYLTIEFLRDTSRSLTARSGRPIVIYH